MVGEKENRCLENSEFCLEIFGVLGFHPVFQPAYFFFFRKKDEAIVEFGKIFRSKTGNTFEKGMKFEKQPKKWRLQETKRFTNDYSAVSVSFFPGQKKIKLRKKLNWKVLATPKKLTKNFNS